MSEREENQNLLLASHRVAVAGRLATLSRSDIERVVERLGGRYVRRVDERTTLLVVGEKSWPLTRRGRMDRNLRHALQRFREGAPPAVVEEREFLHQIGDVTSAMLVQRYTLREISRLLELSCRQLQAWIERGWIRPVQSPHGIDLFDYQAIAQVRQLRELLASGVPPARLARSLRQLLRWQPSARQGLSQLSMLADSKRLLARLPDGRLVEPGGQLQLPLEENGEATCLSAEPLAAVVDPAEIAWELEQAGKYEDAAQEYQHALAQDGDGDAQLWLNYGNVLYALGRVAPAADAFRQAATLERTFAEAWNNLGAACLELALFEEAEAALRQALAIDETYEDAQHNLAELMRECGREDQSSEPLRIYLVQ
jgi:tetratricopeptide (TPR) repeat protein